MCTVVYRFISVMDMHLIMHKKKVIASLNLIKRESFYKTTDSNLLQAQSAPGRH